MIRARPVRCFSASLRKKHEPKPDPITTNSYCASLTSLLLTRLISTNSLPFCTATFSEPSRQLDSGTPVVSPEQCQDNVTGEARLSSESELNPHPFANLGNTAFSPMSCH